MSPTLVSSLGDFVSLLIKVGVSEGPTIARAIGDALAGNDPLAALAKERVGVILPALKLELAMASARVRAANARPT